MPHIVVLVLCSGTAIIFATCLYAIVLLALALLMDQNASVGLCFETAMQFFCSFGI